MTENFNKSLVSEAKANFEEIKKFAEEQASKKIPDIIIEKLNNLFEKNLLSENKEVVKEEMTIKIDDAGKVEIQGSTNGQSQSPNVEKVLNGGEEVGKSGHCEDDETITVSDEEDPIEIGNNIDEMETMENKMTTEANAAPAAEAPVAPATPEQQQVDASQPGTEMPVDGNPTEMDTKAELDSMKSMLAQVMVKLGLTPPADGGAAATPQAPGAEATGEIPVIDDEATAQANAGAPVTEEIEIEGLQFETVEPMEEEIEIIDDHGHEEVADMNEVGRSLGHSAKRSTDRNLFLKKMRDEQGHHAPVTTVVSEAEIKNMVAENVTKIKAQYEAKIAELLKENTSLKKSVTVSKTELKEFGTGFATLKEEFHKMQTFNAKMVMANKLLMESGFSKEDKINILGQFDRAATIEEAERVYKSILKEGKVSSGNTSPMDKIRQHSPKAAKPTEKQTLFESAEVRRQKQLAGIRD